ncbi:MAG TPA: penicillin-binding protein, partial [Alphaproteobacteria bacterium]|nr:penicillin-binding protein [Alphaproteobacteria bacterium]
EPPITSRVHAGDGRLIAEYARERRIFVPIETIPPELIHAFLAAEDRNFYDHGGLDLRGIVRATIANIGHIMNDENLEGASTITQQV